MRAFVNHADGREEEPGEEPVRNHLQACAAQADWGHSRKPEEYEAQVADGTVGGNVLEVLVPKRNEGAENHVEYQERHHVGEPDLRCLGHQEHGDAQAAVGAHLHHHAGRKHRDRGGGCGVAVRTPEVEREQGTRNCKSHEHEREGPHLEFHRDGRFCDFDEVPAVCTAFEVEPEQGRKNHRGAERERQGKFLAAVVPASAAVAGNHQVHAQRFHLVEHEEQHQVETHVHAVHARGEQLDEREEYLLVSHDVVAYQNAAPHDKRREREQEDVEAVRTHDVVRVEHRKPGNVGKEPQHERGGRIACGCTRKHEHAVGEIAYHEEDSACRCSVQTAEQLRVRGGNRDADEYR